MDSPCGLTFARYYDIRAIEAFTFEPERAADCRRERTLN